jgi:GNAT superfamily N-acetyltransferase
MQLRSVSIESLKNDEELWRLYESSLPSDERESTAAILRGMRNSTCMMLVLQDKEITKGFLYSQILSAKVVSQFISYIVVAPQLRKKGWGRRLLEESFILCQQRAGEIGWSDPKFQWLETERIADARDAEDLLVRKNRIASYERWGFLVSPLPYIQPPVDGINSVPLLLLSKPRSAVQATVEFCDVEALFLQKYAALTGIPSDVLSKLLGQVGTE